MPPPAKDQVFISYSHKDKNGVTISKYISNHICVTVLSSVGQTNRLYLVQNGLKRSSRASQNQGRCSVGYP